MKSFRTSVQDPLNSFIAVNCNELRNAANFDDQPSVASKKLRRSTSVSSFTSVLSQSGVASSHGGKGAIVVVREGQRKDNNIEKREHSKEEAEVSDSAHAFVE